MTFEAARDAYVLEYGAKPEQVHGFKHGWTTALASRDEEVRKLVEAASKVCEVDCLDRGGFHYGTQLEVVMDKLRAALAPYLPQSKVSADEAVRNSQAETGEQTR
jgi:hypothetical protein